MRRHPLRWSGTDTGATVREILERGWFSDPGECARVLASIVGTDTISAQGFGGGWPVFQSGGWLVGPSLPVPVGAEPAQGVDGEYSRRRQTVWRETAGAARPFLSIAEGENPPGGPFELLWFGDTERYTMNDATLEIEDLFSVLRVSADRALIERLLVRARRLDPGILEGLVFAERTPCTEIEVQRPMAATAGESWRDPASLLSVRADVKSVGQHGTEITAETVQGGRAVFLARLLPLGWHLQLIEGPYVFTSIHLEQKERVVSLRATPDESIDPMAPGMRGRLVFDLRADLVALDEGR